MISLSPSFKPRLYQETIFSTTAAQNTLVILPTGLGKTAIAAMSAAHRLEQFPQSKILFLAPTKPLAEQHLHTFQELFLLPPEQFVLFTGSVSPTKRKELWQHATFIFSTPQGMENDIISEKISLQDVSLLIFDEAHRTSGDYAYTYLAEQYHTLARQERILALTASPGSDKTRIQEVCELLFIQAIEVRSLNDADIQSYVQDMDINYVSVDLSPEFILIKKHLTNAYEQKISDAQKLGYLQQQEFTKTALLSLQGQLQGHIAQGDKSFELLKTISLLAEALKLQHALELCESQTLAALLHYLHSLQQLSLTSKTKAVQHLVQDVNFKSALIIAEHLFAEGKEHPKINILQDIITKEIILEKDKKIIIFTQFRDTALAIQQSLHTITSSSLFVGQAKKKTTGLTQKQQKEMIDAFKEGRFSVLIATSVAEEGLDIPSVDLVVFYEPVPSAIRTVQRRGRTGRQESGRVCVLISKGTRDEGYRWSAHHKEKRMYRALEEMKQTFTGIIKKKEHATISDYTERISIITDHREKGSPVMKHLLKEGVHLDLQQLSVGDYNISEDVVVEYKTVKDFVDSIIDGRLLAQLPKLRERLQPIIIIEGSEDLYTQRNIAPAAIRGMIAMIILSYRIPILRTTSATDTAGVLIALAKKTIRTDEKYYSGHVQKPWSLHEQQEYVVASLPNIGPKLAAPLLKRFGSVLGVMQASVTELQEIELIGKKKAESIKEVLTANYSKDC
jgi:Fanconi anemia group M protein